MVPGYPQNPQDGGVSQEDEWKNIKVVRRIVDYSKKIRHSFQMLNCISGMVEKTQSAISILQQRQADVVNIRATEELVAEVQTKASIAIMEVKQAALEEIRQAENQNNKKMNDNQTNSKEEVIVSSIA